MADDQPESVLELAAEEVSRRLVAADGALVLDVREPWEIEICRITGSLNIPLGEIPGRAGEIPSDVPVYVLCHHGMRSLRATLWLRRQGYDNVYNIIGGIDHWSLAVDETVPRYG